MGTKRVRTALRDHPRAPIKGQILMLHSDMSTNRDKNEDTDRLWTPSYFKAKLNAPFACHRVISVIGKMFDIRSVILPLPLVYPQLRGKLWISLPPLLPCIA